jgi:hypothetical protein
MTDRDNAIAMPILAHPCEGAPNKQFLLKDLAIRASVFETRHRNFYPDKIFPMDWIGCQWCTIIKSIL